jgi:hypothetical protein
LGKKNVRKNTKNPPNFPEGTLFYSALSAKRGVFWGSKFPKFPKFPKIPEISPRGFPGIPGISPEKPSIFNPRINDYSRKIRKKPRFFPPKFGGNSRGIFPFCKETVFSVFGIFGNFQNFEQKSLHFTNNFSSILSANCPKTSGKSPPKKIRKKSARVLLEKKSANNFYTFL